MLRPGQLWRDTAGHPIHAHGGGVIRDNGTFFWYGENKEHTRPGSGVWHWGVRCYSSSDLYAWDDRGLIIAPDLDDPGSPLHPAQLLDRPHIVRDPRTGRYVCWLRVSHRSGRPQALVVLVAESLLGPYRLVEAGLRPFGMDTGDFDVVVDPDDGRGYCYFERVHQDLVCADLTSDLTGVTGRYTTHFPRGRPPFVREAPAHFARAGKHYLITSGTTWYFPNRSEIATADTYHGPWTVLGDPHPDDPTASSFHSQISSVLRHPSRPDLYIAIADRWLPDFPVIAVNATEVLADADRDPALRKGLEQYGYGQDVDTSRARYVWLPIDFTNDVPVIRWRDEWSIAP